MPPNLSDFANEIVRRAGSRNFVAGLSLLPHLPDLASIDGDFKIHVPECFDEELARSDSDAYGAPHLIQSLLLLAKSKTAQRRNLSFENYRESYFAAKSAGRIVVDKFVDIDQNISEKTGEIFQRAYSKVKGCTEILSRFIARFYRQGFAWAHHNGSGLVEIGDRFGERFYIVEKLRNSITNIIFPEDLLPPDGGLKYLLNQQLPPRLRGLKFLVCAILAYHFQDDVASLVFVAIDP